MNVPNILISKDGALPAKASFYCAGSTQVFLVSGSAYSNVQGIIGVNILIDGQNYGVSKVGVNELTSHKAFVEQPVVAHLAPGSHTIELTAFTNNTQTDQNDFFRVLLFDLG
jgi:hypothetical protein